MSVYIHTFTPEVCERSEGILRGLKFSVKDTIDVAGVPTSCGLKPPLVSKASRTSPVVSKLLEAGATLTGKTNLDPLAADGRGKNEYYGDITHPVFDRSTCLGSSAGAAASIVLNNLDFAIGTDSGGSIRAPAASCNLYGLKLRNSSVMLDGIAISDPLLDSLGILSRDTLTLRKVCETLDIETQNFEPITFFVPSTDFLSHCDHEIQKRFMEWLGEIENISIQEWTHTECFKAALDARKPLIAHSVSKILASWNGTITERLLALKVYGDSLTDSDLSDARTSIRMIRREVMRLLPSNGVIITPTLPYDPLSDRLFERSHPTNLYLALANAADLAAISVPLDYPFQSAQIIGSTEKVVLSALEQLF